MKEPKTTKAGARTERQQAAIDRLIARKLQAAIDAGRNGGHEIAGCCAMGLCGPEALKAAHAAVCLYAACARCGEAALAEWEKGNAT